MNSSSGGLTCTQDARKAARRRVTMETYILLVNFTEKGIRAVEDTIKRLHDFKSMAKKMGADVKQEFWTLGRYDIVIVLEAPDVQTVAALCASVGKLGNVHTETLRSFNEAEMAAVLKKVI
jgi:uncharacterized protein with GYD domain